MKNQTTKFKERFESLLGITNLVEIIQKGTEKGKLILHNVLQDYDPRKLQEEISKELFFYLSLRDWQQNYRNYALGYSEEWTLTWC